MTSAPLPHSDLPRPTPQTPLKPSRLRNLIASLTGLSFMLIGYENGLFGGLTSNQWWNETFDHPSGIGMSTIVASYQLGCLCGSLVTSAIGESLGRKTTIRLGAIGMSLGALMQTLATSRAYLIFARIVSGIGMGFISSSATVLLAEVTPKESRGRYACAQLSSLNFGICLSYWINYGMSKHFTGSIVFRFPISFQLFIIMPIILLTFTVPESPVWLMYHDRSIEARKVLSGLEGNKLNDHTIEGRFRELETNVIYEKSTKDLGYKSFFQDDGLNTRKRLLIGCSVQSFQQLGGCNLIVYHAHFLFSHSLGMSLEKATLISGLLFTWFFATSFIPWFLIDTVGRRPLMITAVTLMGVILAILTAVVWKISLDPLHSQGYGIASAALCFLFLAVFTTGFQATVWFYPPEILPLRARARGNAIATACNWMNNFAVVESFPPLTEQIGWKTYMIFALLNFSFLPIMFYYFPETKGKTLEEIDLLFGDATSHKERLQRMSDIRATLETYRQLPSGYTSADIVAALPPDQPVVRCLKSRPRTCQLECEPDRKF